LTSRRKASAHDRALERAAAVCLCLAFATVAVQAADPSAKSFVEGIYAAYKGKDARGIALDSNAAVRRYFDP
jgi:hypothetical protein